MTDFSCKKTKQTCKNIEAEHVVLQEKIPLSEMPGFQMKKLGTLCSKIGSGATPRGGNEVYLDQGEMALIRSQNVRNEHFDKNGLVFIEDKHAKQLANVTVERGDVLLNITGDSVARCCQVIPEVLPARVNQHVAIIRTIPELLEPRFLRYFLISPYMQNLMLGWAGAGATRNALTKGMIESFEVPVPSLPEQKIIAHILGSLDDKIELNRKMNETLEAMAQALFKSWFIDFDPVIDNAILAEKPVPGCFQEKYEDRKVKFESGELFIKDYHSLFPDEFENIDKMGWIPKGWRVRQLDDLIELIGGGTPKTSVTEYWNGDIPWFSVVDAPNTSDVFVIDTEKHVTKLGVDKSSTKILPIGTTIISARGTVGKCAMVGEPMAMNQSCYGVRGNDGISDIFVYYAIRERVADLQRSGHGSVFNTITRDTFKTIQIPFGKAELTKKLEEHIKPLFDKILANCFQSKEISALRDAVLPKLLSGEVRIQK